MHCIDIALSLFKWEVQLTFWHWSFTFNAYKSPTWWNNFSVYYPDVCSQLNMFRAFSRPSSGAQWLQWQSLVLPSYRGDSRAVFVVGPARLSPWYEGKTRGCHCSHWWAPDDRRENVRNMFSCKQTSEIINWKIVAPGWWFIWIVRWCTDFQTLNFTFKF